jgi:hypothetical protein
MKKPVSSENQVDLDLVVETETEPIKVKFCKPESEIKKFFQNETARFLFERKIVDFYDEGNTIKSYIDKRLVFYPMAQTEQLVKVSLRPSILQRDDDRFFFYNVFFGSEYDYFFSTVNEEVDKYYLTKDPSDEKDSDRIFSVELNLDSRYDHYHRTLFGI